MYFKITALVLYTHNINLINTWCMYFRGSREKSKFYILYTFSNYQNKNNKMFSSVLYFFYEHSLFLTNISKIKQGIHFTQTIKIFSKLKYDQFYNKFNCFFSVFHDILFNGFFGGGEDFMILT